MARIRQVAMPRDLFGDVARGVSLPEISWEDYSKIVRAAVRKFGPSMKRVTHELLNEIIGNINQAAKTKISLVARKSLLVTVLVTEAEGAEASFILSFGDLLQVIPTTKEEIFRELSRRAGFDTELEIKDGSLFGRIILPAKVIVLPSRRPQSVQGEWPNPGQNVEAEILFIRDRQHRRVS